MVFVNNYLLSARNFCNSLHKEHNESCAKHKSEDVNAEECGIWNEGVNYRENRKCAGVVGANEEHIKSAVNTCYVSMMSDKVDRHCDGAHNNENACCTNEVFEVELLSVSYRKINTEEYLNAVVNHCLNVDELEPKENVTGEGVNTSAAKEAKRSKEYYSRITELAVFCKGNYGKNVERR